MKIARNTTTCTMATTIALPRRPRMIEVRLTGEARRRSKKPCSMSVARSPDADTAANNTPCRMAPAAL